MKKKCHTLYILIFCVVGRQVRDGGAYGYAVPMAYAKHNPALGGDTDLHLERMYIPSSHYYFMQT